MSIASKLFGVWVVNKTVTSAMPLFVRLLVGMAAITVFAVIAAIIAAILMAGVVWAAYQQLLQYGINEGIAGLILGSLLLALLAAMVIKLKSHLKILYKISKKILYLQAPISGRLSDISSAFMDGFNKAPSSRA